MIISDYTVLFQEFNFYSFLIDYLKFYYNEDTIELLPIQNDLIIRKFITHDLQEIQDDNFIYELDSILVKIQQYPHCNRILNNH